MARHDAQPDDSGETLPQSCFSRYAFSAEKCRHASRSDRMSVSGSFAELDASRIEFRFSRPTDIAVRERQARKVPRGDQMKEPANEEAHVKDRSCGPPL